MEEKLVKDVIEAVLEVATEIRTLRYMVVSAIAPATRDEYGKQTREGFIRTEEMKHQNRHG
jgi:hypothetical protein